MTSTTVTPWAAIRAKLPGFEPRPQQLAMAAAVQQAIDQKRHLVVEAGTGVGKSFAYLVPALVHAAATGETVVVATRTIALQEQLVERDVPFLIDALGLDVEAAIYKGRSNYVCRRRAEIAWREGGLVAESRDELERVVEWAREGGEGSLASLGFRPSSEVWDKVQAESGNCQGKRCPFYSGCGYQESRHRLRRAKLVIANHSLVAIDTKMRARGQALLPPHTLLVLDEAHELEDATSSMFETRVTVSRVRRLLNRMARRGGRSIFDRFDPRELPSGRATAIDAVLHAHEMVEPFFEDVKSFRPKMFPDRRLYKPESFRDVLSDALRDILRVTPFSAGEEEGAEDHQLEWGRLREHLLELIGDIRGFRDVAGESRVYWVEETSYGNAALASAPVDVAPILKAHLFSDTPPPGKKPPEPRSVVLASATLQVAGGFSHVKRRLGLGDAIELDVGSPFDFASQCRLAIYPRMPDPRLPAFEVAAVEKLRDLVLEADGGAFLLFTSYKQLEACYAALADEFRAAGLEVHKHGEKPVREIVEAFRARDRCVLFGTDTFWQGVDIRGEHLRLVVIVKLPFAVPTDPLRKAREDAIKMRGGNAFVELSIPEAVIRVKQGFGRLIRSHEDRGTVAILDPRVRTKRYGSIFLKSLPACALEER